jgi:hypothetical protein
LSRYKKKHVKRINICMALTVFSNIVADPNATYPTSFNLSTVNNGVTANAISSGVKGVLFNAVTPTTADVNITLNAGGGNTANLNVAGNYNSRVMALLLNDGTSYTFTVNTGTPAQTLVANGYESVGPEKTRLWNLNG